MGIWLEIVTLLIPGFNDSDDELRTLAAFLADVSVDIPWHVTAFHQDYKMTSPADTRPEDLQRAAAIGREAGLRYIYAGNLPGRVEGIGRHSLPSLWRIADSALWLSGRKI
jgi:pyruvate formate lyase activating enzyme